MPLQCGALIDTSFGAGWGGGDACVGGSDGRTDTYNGPTGVWAAVGSGLLRVWPGHRSLYLDLVPVDIVANTLIVAAWDNWCVHVGPRSWC